MSQQPGWYYAEGDPMNTTRWWDGSRWIGKPQAAAAPVMAAASSASHGASAPVQDAFPAAPPKLGASTSNNNFGERSPLQWMTLPYKRYAEFEGRSSRAEFWWYQLGMMAVLFSLGLPGFLMLETSLSGLGVVLLIAAGIIAIGSAIPGWALTVRRLHDTDRSGLWMLIGIIPIVSYVGGFVLLFFYAAEGDRGSNQYGASPYDSRGY